MAGNPFHDAVDDALIGQRVRVRAGTTSYEGWLKIREYNDEAALLIDAVREDGEAVGSVVVHEVAAIERCEPTTTIEQVAVEAVRPSPYTQRSFETANFREFVRTVRERGHLATFPVVRPIEDGGFELVSGHRRYEAARRAGLETIAVEVQKLDDWEATAIFLDEHVPTSREEAAGASERYSGFYEEAAVEDALTALREEWSDERLRTHPSLEWYLDAEEPYVPSDSETDGDISDVEVTDGTGDDNTVSETDT